MNPGLKYTLGRFGVLFVFLVPAVFLFPTVNLALKLLIAFAVSSVVSIFLLRPWRHQMAEQLNTNLVKRAEGKAKLRSALAGEDDEPGSEKKD